MGKVYGTIPCRIHFGFSPFHVHVLPGLYTVSDFEGFPGNRKAARVPQVVCMQVEGHWHAKEFVDLGKPFYDFSWGNLEMDIGLIKRMYVFTPAPVFNSCGVDAFDPISLVSFHHPGYISSSPLYVAFLEVAHHKEVVPEHQVAAHIKKWSGTHLFMRMASFKRRNCSFKNSCITHCCVIVPLLVDRGDSVS